MGSQLKKLQRRNRAPIALTSESHWKEDLLAVNHLLGTLGFPSAARRQSIFASERRGHFVPGVTLTTEQGSVDLRLYDVPGEAGAAQSVWRSWRSTLPTDRAGQIEPSFFSELFFASIAADPDFVEELVANIEAAGIAIPKLVEHERSGLSPVPNA